MPSLAAAVALCCEDPPKETAPGVFCSRFLFPPEFIGFGGHFPADPVLPGIVQIMAVSRTYGGMFSGRLLKISSCKFLRPILPGERIDIRLKKDATAAGVKVSASLAVGTDPCSFITLLFSRETEE
ncbi:MAG: hypothetical protein LBP61_03125 [Desulfovibrio sp.]|nr:hypothetical protein [Desulfovibrio sp.]